MVEGQSFDFNGFGGCRGTPAAKEIAQKGASFSLEHARLHKELVVECGVVEHMEDGAGRACFGIAGSEDEPGQPGVQHGTGAHGAGLKGAHQGAAEQAVVAECTPRLAQGNDFGMGGGVVCAQDLVVATA